MSYKAIVARAMTRPHPNADRLQLATVAGFQVIVGLDVKNGELGVFFPTDGQLSAEFCQMNDLHPRFDDKGKRVGGGFIDPKHRRVKAQTFRGEKSYGFWVPLSYFAYTKAELVEGMQFTELGGNLICNKYINEKTQAQGKARTAGSRKETAMFKRHVDTEQFAYNVERIQRGDLLTLTLKMHGTSFRLGHVYEPRQLGRFKRWLSRFLPIEKNEWVYLNGSRNVILEKSNGVGYYGDESFRYAATEALQGNLHPGEVVYGEIVGYAGPDKLIMPAADTSALNDPAFTEVYGDKMAYTYGCLPGQAKIFVYRITHASVYGSVVELSWNQVKRRCAELGVPHVPEFWKGTFVYEGDRAELEQTVADLTSGNDPVGQTHIREGVVVRVDSRSGETYFLKNKSFDFYVLEGVIKDAGVVDAEEAS